MGQRYILDANVVIDYIGNRLPENSKEKLKTITDEDFNISVVVKIEVLGFNDLPDKMNQLEEFIDLAVLLPLDDDIIKKTIQLRRTYKKLKLGDAIIAATALVYSFTLITCNTKDFKNIEGLELLDPYTD